jgi:hypothetical protein
MSSIGLWWRRLGRAAVAGMVLTAAGPSFGDQAIVEGAILWPGPAETRADQIDAYNAAVRDAAIKRPGFVRTLTPIDTDQPRVRVVALRWIGASDITDARGRLKASLFVALPKELRAACKGAAEPVLALQQILGLPPRTGEYVMVEFGLPTTRVFRPCASGPDVTATSCSFTLPGPASATRTKAAEALAETQAFVFRQMWASYTYKVPTKESFGYPFTAMGWSYDWNPDAEDTFGVSEYIAKQGAQTFRLRKIAPAEFCG